MLVLSGFLTDAECDFIKKYASHRMVPSGLATMDSTKSEVGVRTSTQTFMERGGTAQIRHLEERAHNLTRLPYELGENIQVVRYEEGQKYGAHRDFFNPNDYHRQPSMLRSVEYGARNRLATVFWYLETVSEGHGGETFFPRALNAEGREYHPWNGDHEECYRGTYKLILTLTLTLARARTRARTLSRTATAARGCSPCAATPSSSTRWCAATP